MGSKYNPTQANGLLLQPRSKGLVDGSVVIKPALREVSYAFIYGDNV